MKARFYITALGIISLLFFINSCKKPLVYCYQKMQLGTVVNLTIISVSEENALKTSQKVFDEIERIEALMSPYRRTSDVFRINNATYGNPVQISGEVFSLIEESIRVSTITEGSFDITFASGSHLWKFNDNSFKPPTPQEMRRYLPFINYKHIILDSADHSISRRFSETKIGLGGIAKGYAVRKGIDIARDSGNEGIILEAGGDLQVVGSKFGRKWQVGLAHPREKNIVLSIALYDMDSIATSGDYERYAIYKNKRYHHILDPRTGYPAETFASVSVICKDPVKSDAYATALFVIGLEKAKEILKKDMELLVIFIDLNMKIYASAELKDRISMMKNISIEWF